MKAKIKRLLACMAVFFTMGVAAACVATDPLKDSASAHSQSTDTGSEDSQSTDTGSEDSQSTDTDSEDSQSTDTGSEDSQSADTDSEDSQSTDTDSEDSQSADTSSDAVAQYTITFVDWNDEVISAQTYEEGAAVTAPADPTRAADESYTYTFAGWDKDVVAVAENVTYKATYTQTAIEYCVTFKADGEQVGEVLKYSADNKEVVAPDVPTKAHYDGSWETYTLTTGDVVVNAVYTPATYKITFLNEAEEEVAVVSFNIEDTEKQAPEVPAKKGYTAEWSEYSFTTFADQTVTLSYSANIYEITYDALGGTASQSTQEVVYDSEYTLATATPAKSYQEFLGWVDEEGNAVTGGVWSFDSDLKLTAVYSKLMSFETLTAVPASMRTDGAADAAMIDEKDGDKCLVIPVTGSSPRLRVTTAFLAEFFADSNVEYVAFDAMTDQTTNSDFRRYTMKEDNSGLGNVTYEINNSAFGVTAGVWKSFYFTRADYNYWVENEFEDNFFIITGGFTAGDKLYVDNIRPVTAKEYTEDVYSFETGYMKLSGTNLLAYVGSSTQWQLGIGFNAAENEPSAFGLTNERASQGMRSLSFTKPAGTGDYTVRLNDAAFTAMKTTGYYAFDLYVPEGADTTLLSGITGYTIGQPKAGEWATVYVANTNSKPINIHDTTGGTYAIDHFRSVTAEEFNAGMLDMETGGGAIRDALSDENRFYYYAANDDANKMWSLNFKGTEATLSDPHFDTEITHSGNYSLAFTKTNGYMFMSINKASAMYEELKNGFTFWIYSTVALNGTGEAENFTNGFEKQFGEEGMLVAANTWTQVTITADDINDSGRYLIIQGSTAGTIYIDDICPLSVAE